MLNNSRLVCMVVPSSRLAQFASLRLRSPILFNKFQIESIFPEVL